MRDELRQETALLYRGDRIPGEILLDRCSQVAPEIPELCGRTVVLKVEQETAAADPLDESEVEIQKRRKPLLPRAASQAL